MTTNKKSVFLSPSRAHTSLNKIHVLFFRFVFIFFYKKKKREIFIDKKLVLIASHLSLPLLSLTRSFTVAHSLNRDQPSSLSEDILYVQEDEEQKFFVKKERKECDRE